MLWTLRHADLASSPELRPAAETRLYGKLLSGHDMRQLEDRGYLGGVEITHKVGPPC